MLERRQYHRCGVFVVNSEYNSHLFSSALIVDLEQVNLSWDNGTHLS